MSSSRRARWLMVVLLSIALTGCSVSTVVSPSPPPTYVCVPEAGGDPVRCGPVEYEEAQQRDALYAEAEAVYRRFWAERVRLEQVTDPAMSDELESVTGGKFRESTARLLERAQGRNRISGDAQIVWMRRLPGLSMSGSIVAITVCTDARRVRFANPNGEPTVGVVNDHRYHLSRDADGALKIIDSEYRPVESC